MFVPKLIVCLREGYSFKQFRQDLGAGIVVGLVALPLAILMMGFGLFTNPEARNLPPTLRSMWLIFHVLFNKLAVGAFLLSTAAAAVSRIRRAQVAPIWRVRLLAARSGRWHRVQVVIVVSWAGRVWLVRVTLLAQHMRRNMLRRSVF